jgi:hypothetical protein
MYLLPTSNDLSSGLNVLCINITSGSKISQRSAFAKEEAREVGLQRSKRRFKLICSPRGFRRGLPGFFASYMSLSSDNQSGDQNSSLPKPNGGDFVLPQTILRHFDLISIQQSPLPTGGPRRDIHQETPVVCCVSPRPSQGYTDTQQTTGVS